MFHYETRRGISLEPLWALALVLVVRNDKVTIADPQRQVDMLRSFTGDAYLFGRIAAVTCKCTHITSSVPAFPESLFFSTSPLLITLTIK
jgi:hypothetical protein